MRFRSLIIFALFSGIVIAPLFAADPSVGVFRSTPDGGEERLDWKTALDWKWATQEGDVTLLYPVVHVFLPAASGIRSLAFPQARVDWAPDKNEANIFLSALETSGKARFADGTISDLMIRIHLSRMEVKVSGCAQFGLVPQVAKLNREVTFLGLHCRKNKENVILTVTAPTGLDWGPSNTFEISGKGERWKQYSLSIAEATGRVEKKVELQVIQNQTKVPFGLLPSLSGAAKAKEQKTLASILDKSRISATFGLSFEQLSLKTAGAEISKIQLGLYGDARLMKVLSVCPGIGWKLAFPIPSGDTAISFYEAKPYIAVPWEISPSLLLEPEVSFLLLGIDYAPASTSFRHYNAGVGISTWFEFHSKSMIQGRVMASGYLPSGLSKYFSLELGYYFSPGSFAQWGILAGYQSQSYSNNGTNPSFREILVTAVARF